MSACSWACVVLSLSGSLKVFSMDARSPSRVLNVDILAKVMLVLLAGQSCAIPPLMNDNAYRIFILLSAKALICMVTVVQTDQMNCSVFS